MKINNKWQFHIQHVVSILTIMVSGLGSNQVIYIYTQIIMYIIIIIIMKLNNRYKNKNK